MKNSWTIGSRSDCDLVVNEARISGQHCRLTREGEGYTLEDLNSTNGTYVNGERVAGRVDVRRGDAITLGLTTPMPWPPEGPASVSVVLRIGREPDNDFVVGLPMVSGYHARVVWEGRPGEAIIEDLGSANGTALGSPEGKVGRAVLTARDTVYLGSHPVPASHLLARVDPSIAPVLAFRGGELVIGRNGDCGWVVDLPMVSGRHARLSGSGDGVEVEDLGSANGTFVNGGRVVGAVPVKAGDLIGLGSYTVRLAVEPGPGLSPPTDPGLSLSDGPGPGEDFATSPAGPGRWRAVALGRPGRIAALLVQAPIAAAGIVAAFGLAGPSPTTAEGWAAASGAIGGMLSWLGLAAVWFGLSAALLGDPVDPRRLRDGLRSGGTGPLWSRLGVVASLCVVQSALAWGVVSGASGVTGSATATLGFLVLASAVGLALGLLIVAATPRPGLAWMALPPVVLALWLFGGGQQPLPRMPSWSRAVAGVVPTRWAFEGLLLSATERSPSADPDLAEGFFPADSERMGARADAMALVSLLIGLTASTAFIARASRPAG